MPEEICYVSSVCQHTFCEACVTKKPFFGACPKCGKELTEKCLLQDPKYWAFYECYKRQKEYM